MLGLLAQAAWAQGCATCHPKEVAGFAKSSMSRSLSLAGGQPNGGFEHAASNTHFSTVEEGAAVQQSVERPHFSQKLRVEYQVGSGARAAGFLAQVGDHLFQSPISYYTLRRQWDVAPGYEQAAEPDFSRPVTTECLNCHADKPRPVANTLNSYLSPPFAGSAIGCERCHGPADAHLKKPVPGSILNPAKLTRDARDSICEQCHLAGEIRIPNPGKTIEDFRPGETLEEVFTVYVARHGGEPNIKVISHSEQLALSTCARQSEGKLWCGTCHNPHDKPEQPAAYYRERCLTCHAAKLAEAHRAPDRDCVGCHMPKRPARDGGHTAFTDHRIARTPEADLKDDPRAELSAWREPPAAFRDRNSALALVTEGIQNGVPDHVIRGYRMLNRMGDRINNDAVALTELGTVLLTARQPKEAVMRYERALALRPRFAPYEVNVGTALMAMGDLEPAVEHLERAVQLDPLLAQGIAALSQAYLKEGQVSKANQLNDRYRQAMGIVEK